MNEAIELFGKHIYKLTQKDPKRTLKELRFVYSAAGLQCKYFPSPLLLPARQYMQWAAADAAIKPLKYPQNAAIVSLYLPCELLHAAGMYTMFPEALACYLAAASCERVFIETAETNGISNTLCSYHKAFIGLAETGVLPKPQFIINTSLACDANHLSFKRAAAYYGVEQFMLDVPTVYTKANLNYVADQLHDMAKFIEDNTQKPIDTAALDGTITRSKNTLQNFRKLFALRAQRSLSDEMTSQMLSVFATHVMLGTKEAEKYSADMVKQLSKQPEGKNGIRLLWVHTLPYWQDALRKLLNFTKRCEIIACDMVFDALDTNLDENDPYIYMADRLLRNTANGSMDRRIAAVLNYAEKLNADGIVWYCHWGCKQTGGASARAKSVCEAAGFPTLVLDGDGCDAQNVNDGQTVTRMEAFLELLENQK